MDILLIGIVTIVFAIMFFTAIYDMRYRDVYLFSPLGIWILGLAKVFVLGGGTIELLLASTGGLFLFLIGLVLYITGGTGFIDVVLFWSLGFYIGDLKLSIAFLGLAMICFIPFFIAYIYYFWKKKGYDITWNGFLRQIKIADLQEGMILSQSKRWKGVKKDEIETLKEAHGLDYFIWVKDGIPFAPAMFCGLIFLHLLIQPF